MGVPSSGSPSGCTRRHGHGIGRPARRRRARLPDRAPARSRARLRPCACPLPGKVRGILAAAGGTHPMLARRGARSFVAAVVHRLWIVRRCRLPAHAGRGEVGIHLRGALIEVGHLMPLAVGPAPSTEPSGRGRQRCGWLVPVQGRCPQGVDCASGSPGNRRGTRSDHRIVRKGGGAGTADTPASRSISPMRRWRWVWWCCRSCRR